MRGLDLSYRITSYNVCYTKLLRPDHPVQVLKIFHIDLKQVHPFPVTASMNRGIDDICVSIADRRGDPDQHPFLIGADNLNLDWSGGFFLHIPLNFNPPFGVTRQNLGAILGMNSQPSYNFV